MCALEEGARRGGAGGRVLGRGEEGGAQRQDGALTVRYLITFEVFNKEMLAN